MSGKLLTDIKGVGQARCNKLNTMGIYSISDLLNRLPAKYYDLQNLTDLASSTDLTQGSTVFAKVTVTALNAQTNKFKRHVSAEAHSGKFQLALVWFNNPHALRGVKEGDRLVILGTAGKNNMRGGNPNLRATVINPIIEPEDKVRALKGIMPVYSLAPGIGQQTFSSIISGSLDIYDASSVIDAQTKKAFGLMPLKSAYRAAHFPQSLDSVKAAESRIITELLVRRYLDFYLQNRALYTAEKPHSFADSSTAFNKFAEVVKFTLTNAQVRAIKEIYSDLSGKSAANRIVIGDVGSGKTIVAFAAAYLAAASGGQCVFMAPTEILARQHYKNAQQLFGDLGINTALLTGKLPRGKSEEVLQDIKSGACGVIFATHSAVSEKVVFKDLRLAICDEQQRFGVSQRKGLMQKGYCPDMLFLSATPVPRTLSLALFGEMQVSFIDEKPTGGNVETYLVPQKKADDMFKYICRAVADGGGQVYIICRHIDGNNPGGDTLLQDDYDGLGVNELYNSLKKTHFKCLRVEKLHGRMESSKKDAIMQKFYNGQIDVLIATTLIEVGIDVKNANIIAIMDADKYGLSQLHQLRGRVGRGSGSGHCYLVYGDYTENARERLIALKDSSDGLALAHKDLEIRGAGDFLSEKQHGGNLFAAGKKIEYEDIKTAMQICRQLIDSGKAAGAYSDIELNNIKKIALN